jgi:hypothetical protein
MGEDSIDNAISVYFEVKFNAGQEEGNFGYWCLHDNTLFCQEREGCANCMIALKK